MLPQLQKQVRLARKTPIARGFLVGCAGVGFVRGAVARPRQTRLVSERVAWGALYAGAYVYGHPLIFWELFRQAELALLRQWAPFVIDDFIESGHAILADITN